MTALVLPFDAPYTYAEMRGTATLSLDEERRLIDELSYKYTGKPYDEFNPGAPDDSPRVIVRITPRKVIARF